MAEWSEARAKAKRLRATFGDAEWLAGVVIKTHPDYTTTKIMKLAIFVAYDSAHVVPEGVPSIWEGLPVIVVEDVVGTLDV